MHKHIDQFKKNGKPAYKLLMLDEGYEHTCLSKEYKLDVTEQEVSALCSVYEFATYVNWIYVPR